MVSIISIRWIPKDALDGMQSLKPLEELAYRRILDLIYVTDNNLEDDDERLGWMTKTGKKWKTIKYELIRLGKIEINGGKITNKKCSFTLEETYQYIAQKSEAGKVSAQKRKASSRTKNDSDCPPPSGTKKDFFPTPQHDQNKNDKSLSYNDSPPTDVPTSVPTEPQREGQREGNQPLATSHIKIEEANASSPPAPIKMSLKELPSEWKIWVIAEKGWDESVVADVWAQFREYWHHGKGKTTKRENWEATWRNWCRKENFHQPKQGDKHGNRHANFEKQDYRADTSGFTVR